MGILGGHFASLSSDMLVPPAPPRRGRSQEDSHDRQHRVSGVRLGGRAVPQEAPAAHLRGLRPPVRGAVHGCDPPDLPQLRTGRARGAGAASQARPGGRGPPGLVRRGAADARRGLGELHRGGARVGRRTHPGGLDLRRREERHGEEDSLDHPVGFRFPSGPRTTIADTGEESRPSWRRMAGRSSATKQTRAAPTDSSSSCDTRRTSRSPTPFR